MNHLEALKRFVAVALGILIGATIAQYDGRMVWLVGGLIGGAIGWIAYDPSGVLLAFKKAWLSLDREHLIAFREELWWSAVRSRFCLRHLTGACRQYFYPVIVIGSFAHHALIVLILMAVVKVSVSLGWVEVARVVARVWLGFLLLISVVVFLVMLMFASADVRKGKGLSPKYLTRRGGVRGSRMWNERRDYYEARRTALKWNPFVAPFVLAYIAARSLWKCRKPIGRFVFISAPITLWSIIVGGIKLFWRTTLFANSSGRMACMTHAALGSLLARPLHADAVIFALVGGAVGVIDYAIFRTFRLIPPPVQAEARV